MADARIHAWLQHIGLPHYAASVDARGIGMGAVVHPTDTDLEDRNVAPADRQRLSPALLASLWHGQGKRRQARGLLAPIYASFAAGFQTKELRAAKRMLEGLQA